MTLKDFGEDNRKYRETLINEYSSRSHSIFQIVKKNFNKIFFSFLFLVCRKSILR